MFGHVFGLGDIEGVPERIMARNFTQRFETVACVTAVAMVCVSAEVRAQIRHIERSAGTSIRSVLRPGDTELVVVDSSPRPLLVGPKAGVLAVEWRTYLSDCVLLVTVTNRSGDVTPAGDWVFSTIAARVDQGATCNLADVQEGSSVVIREEGGQALLDGVVVRGVVPNVTPVQVGTAYLMFASLGEQGMFSATPVSVYRVATTGSLHRL